MLNEDSVKFINELSNLAKKNNNISPEFYTKFDVKKGLRNSNGTGVLVGLTEVGEVQGYVVENNEKIPAEGRLAYRGINIFDIVHGFQNEKRRGFEETCYLLIFGELPTEENLKKFNDILDSYRVLPDGFMQDMILKAPSKDIMNKLARSVLSLYSYDNNPDSCEISNVLRQSIELIARFPTMAAYSYQASQHLLYDKSLVIHKPKPELGTAANFLRMIRKDGKYTEMEADLLDLCLVLHAEHGGGNNSSFAVRVVGSTGTDTYSTIAAAVGSLKGPKHGGANIKVIQMLDNLKKNIHNWEDESEIESYLEKIVKKEAFDGSGLIYGLGHAIYTLSDPRAILLKEKAYELAKEKGRLDEFELYNKIERLGPLVFSRVKNIDKPLCINVDFYSGFVYSMLKIPENLCTPLFAISRIGGWCAHRIEELLSVNTIMRPAYKGLDRTREYIPTQNR